MFREFFYCVFSVSALPCGFTLLGSDRECQSRCFL